MKQAITIFLLLTVTIHGLSAQENRAKIHGTLTGADGEPAIGITIFLQGTNLGAVTDVNGDYEIKDIPPGEYILLVSGVGYKKSSRSVRLTSGEDFAFNQILELHTQELEELVVYGKSKATEMREQAYAIEVVEANGFKNLSTNANDILGKISGVNIRQSGGLGSDFSLSLNGLSGNQVRIFLDGVPMDYFGTSLSLNNFSANLIERIEVYKGVVPIHLSSDALGGAINVITGKKTQSYLDASYSIGSFDTHIGSLNAQYRAQNSGFTVRFKSFYNTSQNDYKVPVKPLNFETGKEAENAIDVERFHDAYRSKMAWAETGVTATKYADQLLVGILYSDNYKELQQPANAIGQAKIPYGEVSTEEEKVIANFTYSKAGLLSNKLSLNSYLVGVFSESIAKDTSSYRYDWFGNRALRTNNTTGEIENRKTFLQLDANNYLGNFNAEYEIIDNHNIAINYSLNHLKLQGQDDYKEQNNTQFSNPNKVTKQVLGASYTNAFFGKRLKNTFFTKRYGYKIQSLETNYQGTELNPFTKTKDNVGFGISSTYQFDKIQVKVSYENATRFPEIIELFGDGLNYVPNPSLQPEKSNNYNLGVIFNNRSINQPIAISVNSFIRDAEDFIIPQVQGIKVFHINNGKVLSKGIDVAGSYSFKDKLLFTLNGTYLDLRDNNKWRNGEVGVENTLYKIRLPNVPYLFGNLTISYRKPDLLKDQDNFSISAVQSYVHSFFYRWENLASQDKGIVPEQWTTNLEFVYSLANEKYNASLGISNLWDAKVYDNFQQLRPGRTFNFKLRYFIN
ncbi:TonB-dependent receptor [Fulvivirgaceae bacterium BMA10]|uniref:TonB-dependent receptor n=1 Tax=Splendidivirga corallicola TaxID=3051826 RepID=A0ABT8KPV2_9BACT|nr:TonB-dependent receptor [Fulvivirgaceae bacterium BMA10]